MERIEELLKINGFTLHRRNKHRVYKDSRGLTFVMAHTPSDHRAELNNIKMLERYLTKNGITMLTEKERRPVMQDTFNPPKIIIQSQTPASTPKYKLWDNEALEICLRGRENKVKYTKLMDMLWELGYRTSDGQKIKDNYIAGRLTQAKQKESAPKEIRRSGSKVLTDIMEIITSNLSDEFKLRMIKELVR